MKSGHIQDFQITASSVFRTLNMDMFAWEPRKARLDKQGKVNAWTSGHNDQSQWLQVNFHVDFPSCLSSLCFRHGDASPVQFYIQILLFLAVTLPTLPRALKAQYTFMFLLLQLQENLLGDASTSPSFPLLMSKNGGCRSDSLNSPYLLREMSLFSSLLPFQGSLEKHIYFQLCEP